MADASTDDVYNDPDNILADTDDSVDGTTEAGNNVLMPEKLDDDPRGSLDLVNSEGEYEPGIVRDNGLDEADGDADHPGDVNPADEQDGTEA